MANDQRPQALRYHRCSTGKIHGFQQIPESVHVVVHDVYGDQSLHNPFASSLTLPLRLPHINGISDDGVFLTASESVFQKSFWRLQIHWSVKTDVKPSPFQHVDDLHEVSSKRFNIQVPSDSSAKSDIPGRVAQFSTTSLYCCILP
ncbi:hypothetical protein HELRODRAFT_182121 [Helobdella robusta]|uniref:Uncharacterized protein n=1 Tax=Helobdella robusta TaxID=6412 RepID=T1FHS5_HELRO|nr:hypothetical protein HELRODRAFT_182121 [Helobdella robusta]ESN91262.1 hypothetical protein HELRODRAFT_182121 [Helobdella robusta]